MDPTQALIDLLESLAARDLDGAEDAFEALTDWIEKDGFMPEGIHAALDALRDAEDDEGED